MNTIHISNTTLPIVTGGGFYKADTAFYHADRTVAFNILIYVTKGVIYVTEENTDYSVRNGELLFLKNNLHHYGKIEIPKGTEWHYAHFIYNDQNYPEYIPDNTPIVQYNNLTFSKPLPKNLCNLNGSMLERKIFEFSEYYNSNNAMNAWNCGIKFYEILTEAAFFQNAEASTLSDKIAEYLLSSFNVPFDTKTLSQYFYLSYKRLAAVFKLEKGISMYQYVNTIRMNEACRLLSSTTLSITEISTYVGIRDVLYFSRRFNNFTGYSPTEYRKIHRQY